MSIQKTSPINTGGREGEDPGVGGFLGRAEQTELWPSPRESGRELRSRGPLRVVLCQAGWCGRAVSPPHLKCSLDAGHPSRDKTLGRGRPCS